MVMMSKAACVHLSSAANISGHSFTLQSNAVKLQTCQHVSPLTRIAVRAAGKAGTKSKQQNINAAKPSAENGERKVSGKARPSSSKAGGFGAKASKPAPVDALALLRRSELVYHRMLLQHVQLMQSDHPGSNDDDVILREFVICVRRSPDPSSSSSSSTATSAPLSDWLPVAELVLVAKEEAAVVMPLALRTICRELAECAAMFVPSIPRHQLEYAYETAESFYDEVVPAAMGPGGDVSSVGSRDGDGSSGGCPYEQLGLTRSAAPSEVRSAYRRLAAAHHPDRHAEGAGRHAAEEQFKKVTAAYDRIRRSGNVSAGGTSLAGTYSSLGSTKRAGLSPALNVRPLPADASQADLQRLWGKGELPSVAVRPLEPEIVEVFLVLASKRNKVQVSS